MKFFDTRDRCEPGLICRTGFAMTDEIFFCPANFKRSDLTKKTKCKISLVKTKFALTTNGIVGSVQINQNSQNSHNAHSPLLTDVNTGLIPLCDLAPREAYGVLEM